MTKMLCSPKDQIQSHLPVKHDEEQEVPPGDKVNENFVQSHGAEEPKPENYATISTPASPTETTSTTYSFMTLSKNPEYVEPSLKKLSRSDSPSKPIPENGPLCNNWSQSPKLFLGILIFFICTRAGILVFWIHLYETINSKSFYQTFAWISLLHPMGSIYKYEHCNGEFCSQVLYTQPYCIILGIGLGSVQLLIYATFCGLKKCRQCLLFYLRLFSFIETLFFVFGGSISGGLLYKNLNSLESFMRKEMHLGWKSGEESEHWISTQSKGQCCGIHNSSDWTYQVPQSCKDGSQYVWTNGCYFQEYNTLLLNGILGIALIFSGFLISVVFSKTAARFQFLTKQDEKKAPSSHRIFIRQGSNFTAFGGQGKHSHVIRKDGILVEATGALAASTGLNENTISMEILDYSPKSDKVETIRETDRIVVIITKHGIVRGKALITAIGNHQLEKIVVTPMQFGVSISV